MERTKRRIAGWLLAATALAGLAGIYLWTNAQNDQTTHLYGHTADHTSATVMFVVAGVALLLSVILFSSARE